MECFPQFLPERFYVDIARLVKFGDGIYVRDLSSSSDVVILAHPEEMLAIVTVGAAEETEGVAAGVAEPEVIEKGKKEEEAPEKK